MADPFSVTVNKLSLSNRDFQSRRPSVSENKQRSRTTSVIVIPRHPATSRPRERFNSEPKNNKFKIRSPGSPAYRSSLALRGDSRSRTSTVLDWETAQRRTAKQQLGKDRLRKLGYVFRLVDRNKNGTIEMKEAIQLNRYLQPNADKDTLNEDAKLLFTVMDKDKNGVITKNEWFSEWTLCIKDGRRSIEFLDEYCGKVWNAVKTEGMYDKHVRETMLTYVRESRVEEQLKKGGSKKWNNSVRTVAGSLKPSRSAFNLLQ